MDRELRKLIEELVQIPGPTGFEHQVAEYMLEKMAPYADEAYIDPAGNCIARFDGTSGRSIAILGHMDELSMVVEEVADGVVYIKTVGMIDPAILDSTPVQAITEDGEIIKGVVGSSTAHLKQWAKKDRLFIDVGSHADKLLPGDPVIYAPNLFWIDDNLVASKALDDRHSCAILIQLARLFAENRPKDTVYLVGTCQEEIGMHAGARYIARTLNADFHIAIDTNYGRDVTLPKAKTWNIGDGPVIRRFEQNHNAFTICYASRKLTKALASAAKELNLPFGYDVAETFTDSSGTYVNRPDAENCSINVARRYSHSPHEVVDIRDVSACRDIVFAAVMRHI